MRPYTNLRQVAGFQTPLPSRVRDVLLACIGVKVVAEFINIEQFDEDMGGWIQSLSSHFADAEAKLEELIPKG